TKRGNRGADRSKPFAIVECEQRDVVRHFQPSLPDGLEYCDGHHLSQGKDGRGSAQEIYLRIPGAAEYWHELDVRVSAVLAAEANPKAALDDIYQAWEQITERYGRESQKKFYVDSYVS